MAGFPGGTSGKECTCQSRRQKRGFDPWVRKIPWKRAWQPLQYPCLGNPMDRETVHRIVHSRTDLKWLNMHAWWKDGIFHLAWVIFKSYGTQPPLPGHSFPWHVTSTPPYHHMLTSLTLMCCVSWKSSQKAQSPTGWNTPPLLELPITEPECSGDQNLVSLPHTLIWPLF